MSAEIKMQGLEDIVKRVQSIAELAEYEAAIKKACALVERSAKQKAPKGDGALRRSITSKVDKESYGEIVGVVYTPLEYAPYVEYGTGLFAEEGGRQEVPWSYQDDKGEWHTTSGMKPSPYMRPALNENREEILKLLKESVNND